MKKVLLQGGGAIGLEKAMAPHSSTLAWKIPWMDDVTWTSQQQTGRAQVPAWQACPRDEAPPHCLPAKPGSDPSRTAIQRQMGIRTPAGQ